MGRLLQIEFNKIEFIISKKDRIGRTNEQDERYNNAIFERNIARRQGRLFYVENVKLKSNKTEINKTEVVQFKE